MISLGSLLLLKGNGGVDLGKKGGRERLREVERGGCGQDVLYSRRINKRKNNKRREIILKNYRNKNKPKHKKKILFYVSVDGREMWPLFLINSEKANYLYLTLVFILHTQSVVAFSFFIAL